MNTVAERARKRATESRLRAVAKRTPSGMLYYWVYNLRDHRKYTVTQRGDTWVCHCEGAKGQKRCKHVQRVLDREETRTKQEALSDG